MRVGGAPSAQADMISYLCSMHLNMLFSKQLQCIMKRYPDSARGAMTVTRRVEIGE